MIATSGGMLAGSVAIVAGAGEGLGVSTARVLLREGARVVLTARNEHRLALLEDRLRSDGGDVTSVVCDVTRAEDCERAAARAVASFDKIDAGQRGLRTVGQRGVA